MRGLTNNPWVKSSPTAPTSGLAGSRAPAPPRRHQSCDDLAGGTYQRGQQLKHGPLLSVLTPRHAGALSA